MKRADPNTQYYFIGIAMNPRPEVDTRDEVDNERYDSGNYFLDMERAQMVADCLKAVLACVRDNSSIEPVVEKLIEVKKIARVLYRKGDMTEVNTGHEHD
jgi:hypothetical protein